MSICTKSPLSIAAVGFLLILTVIPTLQTVKIILMYASCDDQLTYILNLMHRSIMPHIHQNETQNVINIRGLDVMHGRHNLSDACMWVLHDTVAVVAITNETLKWQGIDINAHKYNLPHFVSPNLCQCQPYRAPEHSLYIQNLETAVFEFIKDENLHYAIILNEDEDTGGTHLSTLLGMNRVRVSRLRVTTGRPHLLKIVERFFDAWNLVDLSDDGRMMISLGGGPLADNLLKNLVESTMRNKRTKLLVFDNPEKWQKRLRNVKAYEVDLIVVSPDPLPLEDCPVAIELLPPVISHHHHTEGHCTNLSSEYSTLGKAILKDFKENFSENCCSQTGVKEMSFIFWQSWPYENGTQNLKPEAIWSETLGLLRMMPIDLETITLRVALLQYHPYISFKKVGEEVVLENCVLKYILKFLSKRLNFKYKLVTPSDEQWGGKIGPRTWDGAIGMITRGEADIIPYLTSTPSRREVVDYSKPITHVKYGMLVAFPSEPPRAFIFLRPYRKEVWLLLILTAFVISIILHKMHLWSSMICKPDKKYVRGLSTFFSCFWLIFGAMLNQGGVHLPVTNSARLVLASWWLAVLVIMATFSANLIAYLAFPEARWIVKSLGDLVNHKTVKLIISEDCPVLEDILESDLEIYRKIREVYLNDTKRGKIIQGRLDIATKDVVDGKTVIIDDLNYLNMMVAQDYDDVKYCRFTISPDHFSRMDLALGFRRGSSLLPIVNQELQQMLESGILAHWKASVSPKREECFDFISVHGQSEITLEDLQGPFYLLVIGLVFGSLFLSCEYIINKAKNTWRKNTQKKMVGTPLFSGRNSTVRQFRL